MYLQQQAWTSSINICNSITMYNRYLYFSSEMHAQPLTEADCLNSRLILYCMYSMRTARAMAKLRICAGSHEHSLIVMPCAGFRRRWSAFVFILSKHQTTDVLVRPRGCVGWSTPLLFAYAISRFSQDEAEIVINYVFSLSNECYFNVFYIHVSILKIQFGLHNTLMILSRLR